MIVLDTSVLSLAFRRRPRTTSVPVEARVLAELIAADESLGVPGIVLQELLSGTRTEAQFVRLERLMGGFPLFPAGRDDHVRAARIANTCRRAGIAASSIDCLIAAQTIGARGMLFTVDTDFVRIAPHSGLDLFDPDRYQPPP